MGHFGLQCPLALQRFPLFPLFSIYLWLLPSLCHLCVFYHHLIMVSLKG